MKNFLMASLLALFSKPDDTLVFRMQENYSGIYASSEFEVPVEINSIGLRNKEVEPKAPHALRILWPGDSFTFGNGVTMKQTYLQQLERCLPT